MVESPSTHSLSEEPLEDLLLAMEAREESAALRVQTVVGEAQLRLDRGRLGLAVFGAQMGEEALVSLLSFRDGSYSVHPSPPDSADAGHLPQIGKIVRDKERKSTRLGASGQRRPLRILAPLARSAAKLPSGLTAIELRSLAAIDGRTTILNMVRSSRDAATDCLQAFRRLIQLGLATEVANLSVSPTLTMGSNPQADRISSNPPREMGIAQQKVSSNPPKVSSSSPPARRLSSGPAVSESNQGEPIWEGVPPKKATGRWAKGPDQRKLLDHSGYSSVPPPALAAEQTSLPRSLRGGGAEQSDAARNLDEHHPSSDQRSDDGVDTGTVERVSLPLVESRSELEPMIATSPMASLRPITRHDTPTALSAATVRGERTFPAQHYQLRDSEIPIPSSRLDQATLEQLDELNAALHSSRRPQYSSRPAVPPPYEAPSPYVVPLQRALTPEPRLPSEPGPPSSLGLGLPLGELPSPGSVPHPRELPGAYSQQENSGSQNSGLPRVGRYEVLARLKRGGMGSVYMCRLSGTAGFRRLFAMKVLHGHLAEQSKSLEAFFHEARVLGELHHPNIVGIADVGTPQEPYIVMDYVEGGSLAELYRATASGRDPALVVTVLLDALNGLAYAHTATDENGTPLELVHCDVTPHNLLLGVDGSCRVTDFGIARTRKELGDPLIVQGKPGYLAPERLRNGPSDQRSDVFSMGVVLYAGLTGVEPFRGANSEESAELALRGRVQPPSEVGFRPPPALDWVCMTALASEPSARFSSAEEMASHIRRIADREDLIATRAEVGSWVRASLGPTLAARRAASMRGTGHTDPPPAVSAYPSRPPPPLPEEPTQAPSDPPSAADITGPMDPPSSQTYDDNTEIIRDGRSRNPKTSGSPPASLLAKYGTYVAIALGVVLALWALLQPNSFARHFKMKQDSAVTAVQSAPAIPSAQPPGHQDNRTPAVTGKAVEIDEEGDVVLPPIQPAGAE